MGITKGHYLFAGMVLIASTIAPTAEAQTLFAEGSVNGTGTIEHLSEENSEVWCEGTALDGQRLKDAKELLQLKRDKIIDAFIKAELWNVAIQLEKKIITVRPTKEEINRRAAASYSQAYEIALRIVELTKAAKTAVEPRLSEVNANLAKLKKEFSRIAESLGYTSDQLTKMFDDIFALEEEIKALEAAKTVKNCFDLEEAVR